jgi:hypothetical protein
METIIRPAIINDWLYIDSLRKKEGNALGFIPKNAYLSLLSKIPIDGRKRWNYQNMYVAIDNGDLTGYVYTSFAGEYAHIIQIVIQEDARRWHRATLLESQIENDAKRFKKIGIECRVAIDLESNFYWQAMGYRPMKKVISTWLNQKESKSKRPLWHYRKNFGLPLFNMTNFTTY